MDGARYHKRILNPCPTTATSKADIIAWLTSKGVTFESRLTKAELLVTVKANREQLQPIEVIWGIVKNKIACRPSSDMADLERRLKTHFAEVTSSHWVSAHDKCCSFEDAYMEAAENEILALEAEPSEEADGNLLEASSESE
ncbi:hypothetical protein H310_06638 [Aphanomyces invadans]|uniref:Tc1-like transposase DDE domain-containing protein n=1 Tax=Aphanomyces invadans TaxID=157072 RepID=A0A024U545_9STRA|nr:hypothetical protein H310_06638 [Aphanomyces invadans]ETW01002.1 hypothetical protein H310_06638 [Aphanomyces invadans]|eukprot:XP_008870000.1 hypothetical protein H310_06638 [Aphanomyces invadans]